MKHYNTFEEMIEAARAAIVQSTPESSIYVGCDSLRKKKNGVFYASYSTVIILHRDSKRGGQIFSFTEKIPDYGSMKQRLLTEVGYAVRAASDIIEHIGERHLEIHIDVNPNPRHKSSVAVKEAIGYVQGTFGFAPKVKPEAWAASHGGDHIVRL